MKGRSPFDTQYSMATSHPEAFSFCPCFLVLVIAYSQTHLSQTAFSISQTQLGVSDIVRLSACVFRITSILKLIPH